ncbi:MAG: hypothetical protein GC180_04585 [Bacteroidetes bacterium]|nr:hypothetical protein [Bacteroidota bacterium]
MKGHILLSLFISMMASQVALAGSDVRKTEVQACYETKNPTMEIQVWDAGIEDNDSINILLNGQPVVENLRLRKDRQTFQFQLQPGENALSVFAINLGDIPNNTAAIQVAGQNPVSLHSGLQVNGTMKIMYKAPGITSVFNSCPKEYPSYDDDEAKAIRSNPSLQLPSYSLLHTGIHLHAGEPNRKVVIQDCYSSSTQNVDLLVWDCGVEDNDTISLYLNGSWVLQNFRLSKAPYAVPVQLIPGENIVLLYAKNLGDIPDNTAALAVKNQYQQQEVGMMISDMNTCGAIRISYGLTDENGVMVPPCLDENKVDSTKEPELIYLKKHALQTNPGNTGKVNQPIYRVPRNNNPTVVVPLPIPRPMPIPTPRPQPRPTPPAPKPQPVKPSLPKPGTTPAPPAGTVKPRQPNY